MLKRYQVLLNDWMADYIKFLAERYDWSFSETLRLVVAVEIIGWVSANYPKSELKISNKDLVKRHSEYLKKSKTTEEEFHKAMSTIYFEARKAVEFYIAQETKKKK